MITDTLLSRLHRVKQTGPDRWLACCPYHDDKNPSLSIHETEDGRILIHCFAGCAVEDVVGAAGLEMKDLYPNQNTNTKSLKPRERWVPRDVIQALADETTVIHIAASMLANGEKLTEQDNERLLIAARRFQAAAREVGFD